MVTCGAVQQIEHVPDHVGFLDRLVAVLRRVFVLRKLPGDADALALGDVLVGGFRGLAEQGDAKEERFLGIAKAIIDGDGHVAHGGTGWGVADVRGGGGAADELNGVHGFE